MRAFLLTISIIVLFTHVIWAADCDSHKVAVISSAGDITIKSTIQKAIDSAVTGDKIQVGGGTWPESLQIKKKSDLSIFSSCKAVIYGVRVKKSQNIKLEGFIIDAAKTKKHAVHLSSAGNNNIILSK